MSNKYTVIGCFDTGERYCGHHFGETWADAVRAAIEELSEAAVELDIVEVISGHHMGLTESEYVESACDFPATPEGDSP